MVKQKNSRACKVCRYYNVIYKKLIYSFEKSNIGICMQKQEIVQKNDGCEQYKYRPQKEKIVTLEHIDFVVADIKELEKEFFNCNF